MIFPVSKEGALCHLLALPTEDRYSRFCHAVSDDYLASYVEKAPGFFAGAYVPSLGGYTVAALVHTVFYPQDRSFELAVSVLPEYKGRGFGKQCMTYASRMAEAYNAESVIVTGLSSNDPMIELAESCGFDVSRLNGEFEGKLRTIGADLRQIISNNIKLYQVITKGLNEPTTRKTEEEFNH